MAVTAAVGLKEEVADLHVVNMRGKQAGMPAAQEEEADVPSIPEENCMLELVVPKLAGLWGARRSCSCLGRTCSVQLMRREGVI